MALTDTTCRNAKPGLKPVKDQASNVRLVPVDGPYKLSDEKGLYLLVQSAGKYWRFDYRHIGKRKTLALGVYPDVALRKARDHRDEARKLLADGIDPMESRKQAVRRDKDAAANSFEAVAREWFAKHAPGWAESHAEKILNRLENDVFPWIGPRPIAAIEPPDLLAVARRVEDRGTLDTAHRALQNCGQVFRYAVATGRAQRDPTADLRGALPPLRAKDHFATITEPAAIGELMRAIDGYAGSFITRCALKLAPLVFVRPGELRHAEWTEINLDEAEWRIPAEKMKGRVLHIVPLSVQAIANLRELHPLTGHGRYVFPGEYNRGRPMSENTILAALRRLGYSKDQMTGHGFRGMASTLLNEQGWKHDAIERQLAHAERNKVRAAYNYAEHLPERRKMMQAWADYLDTLRQDRKVVAGNFGRAA